MPPSPMRAATSYGPTRLPGARATEAAGLYVERSEPRPLRRNSREFHGRTFRKSPYRYHPSLARHLSELTEGKPGKLTPPLGRRMSTVARCEGRSAKVDFSSC